MVKKNGAYREVIVHIVMGKDSVGRPKRQVRPVSGQGLDATLNVECARKLREDYPLGTKFRMRVRVTDMKGSPFLYSFHGWAVDKLE